MARKPNRTVDDVIELVQTERCYALVQAIQEEPRALTELAKDSDQFNIHELSDAANRLSNVGVIGKEPYPDSRHKHRYVVTERGRRLLNGISNE